MLYVIEGPIPEYPSLHGSPVDHPLLGQHPFVTEIVSAVP